MNIEDINFQMQQLALAIGYKDFNKNTSKLKEAMCSAKIKEGKQDRKNEKLALVGDSILDLTIVEIGYKTDLLKGNIDDLRKVLANNKMQYKIFNDEKLLKYAYNDLHFAIENKQITDNEKVSISEKDFQYLEAIIGAIYYDKNLEEAKYFVRTWYLPKAKEIAIKNIKIIQDKGYKINIDQLNALVFVQKKQGK